MWLVVGLGNPGEQYAESRHNIGFMVVDKLAQRFPGSSRLPPQYRSHLFRTLIQSQEVLLVQPQTYMNRSGLAVKDVFERYHNTSQHLVVIYDDLDLEPGRLRIRVRGGHGGHKGVKSIIEHLGTNEFVRLKIGIGHPCADAPKPGSSEQDNVVDYVLQPFQPDEQTTIQTAIDRAADAVECIVTGHIEQAMNVYNRR